MTTSHAVPKSVVVSDADLARAAAAGDRAALARIYHRYAGPLHDLCMGIVRDHHTAADCVQDVFCAAMAELPKLRDPNKLRPWLYAIARRTALRALRERRREPTFDELPDNEAMGPGPFTLTAQNELAQLITAATGGLSERDRRVLDLAYRRGLSVPDLAAALGVSYDSAKKLVQRVRDTVERSLAALLVARRATKNGCPQLAATVAGPSVQLTTLLRKRIARHIDSCSTCAEERRRVVSAVSIIGGAALEKVS